MTKTQLWIFNVVCLILIALLITQFFISRSNTKLTNEMNKQQAVIKNAQQLEPVLDQLAKRIARDSDTNAAFRNLLVKYDLRVTLEVEGKQKKYP
ncbi:MAG: hypothetical protein ABIR24_04430 [Verrucomicrobiota bacterium]